MRLQPPSIKLVANIDAPRAAAQVARWIEFTAGSVTAADVRERLEAAASAMIQ